VLTRGGSTFIEEHEDKMRRGSLKRELGGNGEAVAGCNTEESKPDQKLRGKKNELEKK